MPIEVRAAQTLMVAVYGDALAAVSPAIRSVAVGGVILMTWPEGARAEDLAAIDAGMTIPLLRAVDEEGGPVQRLRRLGRLPAQAEVAASMSADAAEQLVAAHASLVASLGIDMVFGPVVDVAPIDGADPIGERAFSRDPLVVAEFAAAYVRAWQSVGILPVLKHFPGHGSASADTHDGGASTPPLPNLLARDLVPYQRFAGESGVGVMVGHLDVPGLTDQEDLPTSLSHATISGLLRSSIGMADALVVTDALAMEAIAGRFSVPTAAVLALQAGADLILSMSVEETGSTIDAIVTAVASGQLSEERLDEAVSRVLRQKEVDPCSLF